MGNGRHLVLFHLFSHKFLLVTVLENKREGEGERKIEAGGTGKGVGRWLKKTLALFQ
jgi:hypothetical protein